MRRANTPARFARVVVLIGVLLCATRAGAQRLTIQGDRFAIDGTPTFLLFVSYFGAMGAPNVAADFHFLRAAGFNGVRIWPNIDTGPQLMNGDGSLRPAELSRLRYILDQARLEHLVVDVTFTYEHIAAMTPATARVGIAAATQALRSYDNLLFDIQNERNVTDRRFMSETDVGSIFAAIKAVDPSRIATADNSLGEDWGPQYAADFTARLGLDLTAFHESRRSDWYTAAFYGQMIGTLRSNGRPVYLQEPNSTRDATYTANDRATYYLQALANARLLGAAAWCFHTLEAIDFGDGGPSFLEDRLRAFPEPEWAFVTAPKPTGTTPGPPTGLAASVAGSTLTLAWAAPAAASPPTTYVIEGGAATGSLNLVNFSTGTTATSFAAAGVPGGTYFVRVRAANSVGSGGPSNEVAFTVAGNPTCTGPPGAPGGLASSMAGSTVMLSWTISTGPVTSFIVEAGSASGLSNLASFDTGSSSPTLTTTGVRPGSYFVRTRAKNTCGLSAVSNEVVITIR